MDSITNELKAAGFNLKKVNYNPFESETAIQSLVKTDLQEKIVEKIKAEIKKSLLLPTDYERSDEISFVSKRVDLNVPAATLKAFVRLSEQEHCSLYHVLVAGFSLFVSKLTHSEEVVIGLFDQQKIVPIRLQLALTENFSMIIREVRKKVSLKSSENLPFNIVFNYEQKLTDKELLLEEGKYEIFINAFHADENLVFECHYNSVLFELTTITSWLQFYAELLSSLIELRTETLERLAFDNLYFPKLKERSEHPNFESEHIPTIQKPVKSLDLTKIFKSMLVLSNNDKQTPVCLFHSLNGDVHEYFPLAHLEKEHRTVLAFQSLGKDEITDPLTTIEEMANFYIRELKALKPKGPYILAGASMGGIIAFEAACQLIEQGDKVEKLIVFNAFGPHEKLQNFKSEKSVKLKNKFMLFFKVKFFRMLRMKLPLKLILKSIKNENHNAIKKYEPKMFYGDLHLIRNKSDEFENDPVMGWKGVVKGKIKIFRINKSDSEFLENPLFVETFSKILNSIDD